MIIFIIANNYKFTFYLEPNTFIRTKCSAKMRVILGSTLCQEAPFDDEFDLIEAKSRGVNEQS